MLKIGWKGGSGTKICPRQVRSINCRYSVSLIAIIYTKLWTLDVLLEYIFFRNPFHSHRGYSFANLIKYPSCGKSRNFEIRYFDQPEIAQSTGLWGMYKRSEPIKSLHSVQNHMANVYSSEVCLQTKNFPKISKFFFSKNTPKYDKLSKISNISIKTILELRTKFGNFGNFGNFGHISDRLRTIHNTCSNLIGSEPLYILPTVHRI